MFQCFDENVVDLGIMQGARRIKARVNCNDWRPQMQLHVEFGILDSEVKARH